MGRYREIQGDTGRYGEIGEIWGDSCSSVPRKQQHALLISSLIFSAPRRAAARTGAAPAGRCGEMRGDAGREHARVPHQRARDRDALLLPAAQLRAPLADGRGVAELEACSRRSVVKGRSSCQPETKSCARQRGQSAATRRGALGGGTFPQIFIGPPPAATAAAAATRSVATQWPVQAVVWWHPEALRKRGSQCTA